jgi:hypothetical protein
MLLHLHPHARVMALSRLTQESGITTPWSPRKLEAKLLVVLHNFICLVEGIPSIRPSFSNGCTYRWPPCPNLCNTLRATSAKGQFDFHANLSTLCYCPSCLASTCVLLCCEERDQAALIVMLTTSRCRCSCHVFVIPCHAMCSLPMFRSPHAHISIGLAPMSRSPCADVSLGLAPTILCEYPLALRQ